MMIFGIPSRPRKSSIVDSVLKVRPKPLKTPVQPDVILQPANENIAKTTGDT